jgi:hypothetical protein
MIRGTVRLLLALPRDGLFALRAHPSGRPAGDRRRCAASSNRLVFCRRFELTRQRVGPDEYYAEVGLVGGNNSL